MPALTPLPAIALASGPSPVEELQNLRKALGGGPRLLIKRDDTLSFAFGGNKVRKMQLVAADAVAQGADTLITSGGVQSNHARVTAAAAARLGMHCILVVNGTPPDKASANALLDRLLGAEIRYVARREDRAPAMEEAAGEMRRAGRRPYVIPIGASTPLGAAAFAQAVEEMLAQLPSPPDVIIHSTSSGGTQAGLIVGCARAKIGTQVIGISADEPAAVLSDAIANIAGGLYGLLEPPSPSGSSAGVSEPWRDIAVAIDDRFVGGGYGVPTAESQEAIELLARTEAIFLDPTYTAKAMAGLIARVRAGAFTADQTVLFWHTGGQVGLFA